MLNNEELKELLIGSKVIDIEFGDFFSDSLHSLTLETKSGRKVLATVRAAAFGSFLHSQKHKGIKNENK